MDISGHYAFNDPAVKKEIKTLYANLQDNNIDGQRFVIKHIKRPLLQYIKDFNLTGFTTELKSL